MTAFLVSLTWFALLPATHRAAEADAPSSPATPATPGAILSPEEELRGFTVPAEFTVELVAAETPDYGKFVALAFDSAGRLWTMTAMEYPVDANENPAASAALFARGGRDKVLVFDRPYDKESSAPRVFADGLVMPLGILPYRDGAFIQYGEEIRFYRDRDGDGKADNYEAVLQGFGTEDSHLFPHQFTRVPGGHILFAQGLFNSSTVTRPDGRPFASGAISIPFNHCKLGRFSPDGSEFEALTAGPNNIWGLTISREGETWIQEANDLGFPIIPFAPGGLYPTGSAERLRPYQPMMPPPLAPAQMGGTGLSGLALADDADGWPAPWGARGRKPEEPRTFYVANPITSRIQVIRARWDGKRYRYEKGEDFLVSRDERFRPVAIQFGPDGCLYIVDWYNKIISHNEVPRSHPERDKSSGRIWRIRHRESPSALPPNLAALDDEKLVDHLGAANARIADFAWQEIVDRRASELVPRLLEIARDRDSHSPRRLGALWALEGLESIDAALLSTLASDDDPHLRREAARIAGRLLAEQDFLPLAKRWKEDPSPAVRAALGDALRRVELTSPEAGEFLIEFAQTPSSGDAWETYDRDLERFLARWAMEVNGEAVLALLESPSGTQLGAEQRVFAAVALGGARSAVTLARLVPELGRPLSGEEIALLAAHLEAPEVRSALQTAVASPASRTAVLEALVDIRMSVPVEALRDLVAESVVALWNEDRSSEGRRLAFAVAEAFDTKELASEIASDAIDPKTPADERLAALRVLRRIGPGDVDGIGRLIDKSRNDAALRKAALAVLTEGGSPESAGAALSRWDELNYAERGDVARTLASHRPGASALLAAWEEGDIESSELPMSAIANMRELLSGSEAFDELWREVAGRLTRVLCLTGEEEDGAGDFALEGPFTVECWIQFSGDISNADSLIAAPGKLDVNFHDGRFRVWLAEHGDIAIADYRAGAESWNHFAVSRDRDGIFRLSINGEPAAESEVATKEPFPEARVGRSLASGGTAARLAELRIWNEARSEEQIRDYFDRALTGDAPSAKLAARYSGEDWPDLHGEARIEAVLDAPQLVTPELARGREEKFARYRALANSGGDAPAGRSLFEKQCLTCHEQGGRGAKIGPALDGVGLRGVEALLRNLLTPSAAMEGGYRNFRVVTRDGRIEEGMLVAKDENEIVLRRQERADLRIAADDAVRAEFTQLSVMPEGLLEALHEEEVRNLFAYLKSLDQTGEPE